MTSGRGAEADDDGLAMFRELKVLPLPIGATPRRNPKVTIAAAAKTRTEGRECVCSEDTNIVRGRTMPLAI